MNVVPNILTELVDRCQSGSRSAQEQIYKLYAPRMFSLAMRYAKDTMEAEDILVMGFNLVFANIRSYSGAGSFEGWVRRVIINTALSACYRKKKRVPTTDLADVCYSEGADYLPQCEMDYLFMALQSLPAGLRLPFNMFAIEGYSHREIAKELGLSESLSRIRVLRARRLLQEKLMRHDASVKRVYSAVC